MPANEPVPGAEAERLKPIIAALQGHRFGRLTTRSDKQVNNFLPACIDAAF